MIIKKDIDFNKELTEKQKKMLEMLENRPVVFDEDCPELTKEELSKFKRVSQQVNKKIKEQTA